jgi:hypothetical protein
MGITTVEPFLEIFVVIMPLSAPFGDGHRAHPVEARFENHSLDEVEEVFEHILGLFRWRKDTDEGEKGEQQP